MSGQQLAVVAPRSWSAQQRSAQQRSAQQRSAQQRSAEALVSSPEQALAALYRSHYGRMVRLACAIVGSPAAAEDAVQDAYVDVWRHLEGVHNAPAYLRRAVVNRCTSVMRRRVLEERHARPEPAVATDDLDSIKDALTQLPPRQRAALVLRFYEDLPDDEIASILGVRRATVRSLVHRGVQQLRAALS